MELYRQQPAVRPVARAVGAIVFSVVIGPSKTREDRSEILRKVRRLGYKDAYPV